MQPSPHSSQHHSQASVAAAMPAAAVGLPSLRNAMAFGTGVVTAAFGIAWATRLLPPATTGYVAMGAGAALVAAVLGLYLHGRFLDARAAAPFARDGHLMAGRLQGLLAAAFGTKLAVLVLGMLYLHQFYQGPSDLKFAATASFCIAFAAASLLCQLATAGYLARALGRRNNLPPGIARELVARQAAAPNQLRR